MENDYSYENLKKFGKALKEKIPDYEWFLNSFRNLGWSNHTEMFKGDKNKDRVKITLEIVEQYVSQQFGVAEYTIEHILPDSESEENAHIGNLIPLEYYLNRECGVKTLKEKYEIYRNSSFASARGVSKRYVETDFDVRKRTEYLCKLIYNNILELTQFDFAED